MESVPMTLNGYKKLQEELKNLKNVERPRVAEAIASARALGDLSENAEYHAAKERQRAIESRMRKIDDKLSRASVIDVSGTESDTVMFGCTVKVEEHPSGTVSEFQIVGSDEADVEAGLIPITAPMARALIGKKAGNDVEVSTPGGTRWYTIISLAYV